MEAHRPLDEEAIDLYRPTRLDVAATIERFLQHDDQGHEWDYFISVRIKHNPELERIRRMCGELPDLYPVEEGSKGYCGTKGLELLRGVVRNLRHENQDPPQA